MMLKICVQVKFKRLLLCNSIVSNFTFIQLLSPRMYPCSQMTIDLQIYSPVKVEELQFGV